MQSRMSRKSRATPAIVLRATVFALVATLTGCSNEDTDRLGRIGRKTMARADTLTASLRGKVAAGIEAIRTSLPATAAAGPASAAPSSASPPFGSPATLPASLTSTPVDARVRWRIRWDKALAGAEIEVNTPSSGVVQLRGIVNDLTRQRRAIELAETTEGVERVVNDLGLKQPSDN